MEGNIVYFGEENVPHYDLLADSVAYTTVVKFRGEPWKAYPLIRAVSREEMKQVRIDADSKVFMSKFGERKIKENKIAYHRFIMKNFLRFYKAVPEHRFDIHRQVLQSDPAFRLMIYYQSVRGLQLDSDEDIVVEFPEGELVDLPVIVPTIQTFYDPQSGEEVKVRMVHYMEESTELRRKLEEATKETRISPGKYGATIATIVDHDAIVSDYENSIIKVEGYCMGSIPCGEQNVFEWKSLIPFEHMMLVMDNVQNTVAEIA